MATKEWHLLITSPSSTWSNLYDRHFESKLLLPREKRLYKELWFEFDPYIHVEAAVFDKIKNDSAFIGTAFGGFKPIIDRMLEEFEKTIRESARHGTLKGKAIVKDKGETQAAFEVRIEREYKKAREKKVERLSVELWMIGAAYEAELQMEAKRQLDAWNGLPKDVKRYERGKIISKSKITVLSTLAVAGAGLATASVAINYSPFGVAAAAGAWYGAVRTVAGGVQEWKLLNKSLSELMETIKCDLEAFSRQTNHVGRGIGAGFLTGASGVQIMTQISGFESKLNLLNGKLPQLKLTEGALGKAINELLDKSQKLDLECNNPAKYVAPELKDEWRKLQLQKVSVENSVKSLVAKTGVSHTLEGFSKQCQAHVQAIRQKRGNSGEIAECVVKLVISVGLSSGLSAGMAGASGIDFKSCEMAVRTAAALDTAGLTIGALTDLDSLVNNIQALSD